MALPTLDRPLVIFDLETTGLLIDLDRIIEIALVKIHPDGRTERLTQRFDPGIQIPAESLAIHGITNDALKGEPTFTQWAPRLFEIFRDSDLGGFALFRLDIPMLTKEFERCGLVFSAAGRRVVDASVIYREKERRDLRSALRFYCGRDLVNAHAADADVQATVDVLAAQLDRYPDLPRDLDGLHEFCSAPDPTNVDRQGRLVWRDGEAFFSFGKHRYRRLADVTRDDPDYLDWIVNKADFAPDFTDICRQARRGFFPRRDAPPSPPTV